MIIVLFFILGHSLGLSHSDKRDALMAPFYKGWEPNLQLDQDDIRGIQALYGESKVIFYCIWIFVSEKSSI